MPNTGLIQTTALEFVVDKGSVRRDGGRQVYWPLIPESFRLGSYVVTVGASALISATTISINVPLGQVLPIGAVLDFGTTKYARLTQTVTGTGSNQSVTVAAIPTALAGGETATVFGTGPKYIKAGTVMCLTTVSGRDYMVPRANRPGSETADSLLATNATEGSASDASTGYGRLLGAVVYENLLPEQSGGTINGTYKTELGAQFQFLKYNNTQ